MWRNHLKTSLTAHSHSMYLPSAMHYKHMTHSRRQSERPFESFSDFWMFCARWWQTKDSKKRLRRALANGATPANRGCSPLGLPQALSRPLSPQSKVSGGKRVSKATQWVRDMTSVLFLICCLTWGGLGIVGIAWMLDSEPPIKMLDYTVAPVYPGGTTVAVADVERNLSRKCDAVYSRRFVDSRGAIFPLESDTSMGASAIKSMDTRQPGKLIFAAEIPASAAPGKGMLITPLRYNCNPWHSMRPITMSLEMQAEVLAP